MELFPLIAALVALAGIVGFVAAPLVRAGPPGASTSDDGLQLLERRDRALTALRELEFDHRTGKIGDDDYAALLGSLRRDAADALAAVEAAT